MLKSSVLPLPWMNGRRAESRDRFRSRRPPLTIVLPVLAVSILMLLPLLYVVVRATGTGSHLTDILFRERTLTVVRNTALLAMSVSLTAVVISVPLAWLTTRTALAGRRFWSIAATLPLVVPSYVGALTIVAALGPRGLAQG
ncbi:MAG: hypothetical protein M3457_05870, partial [Chloroflexota bacterium]|nr:hypothetical protein [Chloroflexota bacterium]